MRKSCTALLGFGLIAVIAFGSGCTMCSTDHMCDYAGAGGKWQRGNPACGRVGSIMSDAGASSTYGDTLGGQYGDSWGLVEGEPQIDGNYMQGDVILGDGVYSEPVDGGGAIMIAP